MAGVAAKHELQGTLTVKIHLPYGDRSLTLDLDEASVVSVAGPETAPLADQVEQLVEQRLDDPLSFPRLGRAVVPGDRVAVVVGPEARALPVRAMVAPVVRCLVEARVEPEDIALLATPPFLDDPELAEPNAWAHQLGYPVSFKLHDPTDRREMSYLAATEGGQRVYLDRAVVDADMVILVGRVDFDPISGYTGGRSALWPGLSDAATIRRHLGRLDLRAPAWAQTDNPARQEIEEVGWLLGTQFAVQAVADARGAPTDLLAGEVNAVMKAAIGVLDRQMRASIPEPVDLVVCCAPCPAGSDTLGSATAALAKSLRWVRPHGHVVLVSPCTAGHGLGQGHQWLRDAETPSELLKALQAHPTPEARSVGLLAAAAERVHLYLLSDLPDAEIEDLFITSLGDVREIGRLADRQQSCAVILDGTAMLPDCPCATR